MACILKCAQKQGTEIAFLAAVDELSEVDTVRFALCRKHTPAGFADRHVSWCLNCYQQDRRENLMDSCRLTCQHGRASLSMHARAGIG